MKKVITQPCGQPSIQRYTVNGKNADSRPRDNNGKVKKENNGKVKKENNICVD